MSYEEFENNVSKIYEEYGRQSIKLANDLQSDISSILEKMDEDKLQTCFLIISRHEKAMENRIMEAVS